MSFSTFDTEAAIMQIIRSMLALTIAGVLAGCGSKA